MNIYRKHVIDKQSNTITVFWEVLINPIARTLFYGYCAGCFLAFAGSHDVGPWVNLGRLLLVIYFLLLYKKVYHARISRKAYESAVIKKSGVIEGFFKVDDECFELGIEKGFSRKCYWDAIRLWTERADAFVFCFDQQCVQVRKDLFLTPEEALELREFLKKNFLHKAV